MFVNVINIIYFVIYNLNMFFMDFINETIYTFQKLSNVGCQTFGSCGVASSNLDSSSLEY